MQLIARQTPAETEGLSLPFQRLSFSFTIDTML